MISKQENRGESFKERAKRRATERRDTATTVSTEISGMSDDSDENIDMLLEMFTKGVQASLDKSSSSFEGAAAFADQVLASLEDAHFFEEPTRHANAAPPEKDIAADANDDDALSCVSDLSNSFCLDRYEQRTRTTTQNQNTGIILQMPPELCRSKQSTTSPAVDEKINESPQAHKHKNRRYEQMSHNFVVSTSSRKTNAELSRSRHGSKKNTELNESLHSTKCKNRRYKEMLGASVSCFI